MGKKSNSRIKTYANYQCSKCSKKRKSIGNSQLCRRCYAMKKLTVKSGNLDIDNFIKRTQSSKNTSIGGHFLEWEPYDNFENIEYIGKGGFSQIYKATWKKNSGISFNGDIHRSETKVVLKVLNNSQNMDKEFLKELEHTFQFDTKFRNQIIRCFGVTQDPKTSNFAFILEYAHYGDLHNFLYENFEEFSWKIKNQYLNSIIEGIKEIHEKKIIHRDLHSGNILVTKHSSGVFDRVIISDLGFSQPATIDSNLTRKSQIYGIISYMAPELFKNQPYSYASDIYSLGMIMWQLTSGHKPFHDQEYGPKLILNILDGKRPKITDDTPESWANVMKRCWHFDPSQRPKIEEIWALTRKFKVYNRDNEDYIKKKHQDSWLEIEKAEKKRLEMIESKKPFVKNPGYEHPNSRYYSTSLNSMLESINSTITDPFSNDHFDIMDSNKKNEKSKSSMQIKLCFATYPNALYLIHNQIVRIDSDVGVILKCESGQHVYGWVVATYNSDP
ncbi:hypothetical protein Glove_320g45 [Diversispora epigaea]|uniref:Protein kinase domain-containing protein n=1 Tax=Diversispora epigaea TaxID=1348612 RepID=A0A397HNR7_9GLOM|nr:hypothetical protein Glove_320g45 [Diversispora epigaea]